MFFNPNGGNSRQFHLFSINKIIFAAFFLITGASFSAAQEIPCLDARSSQIKFVKAGRDSGQTACGKDFRKSKLRENTGGDITISGTVTHQNGVRMSGITMTLEHYGGTTRTVVTDNNGFYRFDNLAVGSYELTPSRENYQFYPPAVIWEGIVESAVQNFIAVGPPPTEPPPPPGTPMLAWSNYYDGADDAADYNGMIGRDAAGNVYLGGTSYLDFETGNTDIVLSKLDANGNRLWSRSFNGEGNYKDGLEDMAVDANGNVYLTGYSYSGDTNPANRSYNFAVLKYDTNGNLLWTKYYDGNIGYDDSPTSLKIAANGNIYVTGYSWGIGTYANYATIKYDASGNQVWARRFAGGNGEIPYEVEVDAGGSVYVTGTSNRTAAGGSEDIVTIKYAADGTQLWLNRYNSATQENPNGFTDEGFELEINAAGDVLVLGRMDDMFESKLLLHKIAGAGGAAVWTRQFSPSNGFFYDYPSAMELDAGGNIILTGTSSDYDTYNVDSFAAKLDAAGVVQWLKTYDGLADEDYDGDPKLALDGSGNVFVGVNSEGFANPDMQIIKYLPDGAEDWRYRFGNPFFGGDGFLDWHADAAQTTMLVDAAGGVYIAGDSFIPDQSNDLVAFKLQPDAPQRAAFDFDGDRKADIAVFRPETGVWYIQKSSDGSYSIVRWGLENDKLVPADYDGDGKNDLGVYRDGIWYVLKSSDSGFLFNHFGLATDKPVPADFDNDGRTDLSVFRQGIWHQLMTSNNAYKAFQFGLGTDTPIPSDYDKNTRSDVAVYRGGNWFVSFQAELPMSSYQFGINTDKPVPADYDGDAQTDYAVFRNGVWYIRQSRSSSYAVVQWGLAGDVPVPADYDGDKKTDLAVYRGGVWYILRSSDNNYTITQFGLPNDIPIPAAYTR